MDDSLAVSFAGGKRPLFRLALRTSLATVLTLGLYRFWMRTRMRRYYWSSVRPGGVPLEYAGEPLEKLLGFLVAVVVLAFYIGVVNLVLMFASFAIFHGNVYAYAVSFAGVVPLVFFAQYRARRYVMARTRWRGIRFGVAPGAWGYAFRAMLWWLATIVTLGLLWPRMTYALEKYRTDRTWLGGARFEQGGSPWMLMLSAAHVWFGLLLMAIGIAGGFGMAGGPAGGVFVGVQVIGILWTLFGLVYYRVDSFRRLTGEKRLGGVRMASAARPWRILRHYVFGYFLTVTCLALLVVPTFLAVAAAYPTASLGPGGSLALPGGLPPWVLAAGGVALYFLVFVLWGVLRQVFVGLPNLRHYAETLTIIGAAELAAIRQRDRDASTGAEGFADALDVGAAI